MHGSSIRIVLQDKNRRTPGSIWIVFHDKCRRDSGDDVPSDDTIGGKFLIAVVRYPNLAFSDLLLYPLERFAHSLP